MTTAKVKAFIYNSMTGELFGPDDKLIANGYSGHGAGLNNPAMEAVEGVGPIPRGDYSIGPAHTSPRTGPVTMRLTPIGHDAHKRTAIEMHGDNALMNKSASHGCVIAPRTARDVVAGSDVKLLTVI